MSTVQGRKGAAALSELRKISVPDRAGRCASAVDDTLARSIKERVALLRPAHPCLPENAELNQFLHMTSLANLIDCVERTMPYSDILKARTEIDLCAIDAIQNGYYIPPSISKHSEKVLNLLFEQVMYGTALATALRDFLKCKETRDEMYFTFTYNGASRKLHIYEARTELIPYFERGKQYIF